MLGYLCLPAAEGGKGRTNVDGLTGPAVNVNDYNGTPYPIHHLAATMFKGEAEDPDHSGASVDEQLANGGQGFVSNFARISKARAEALKVPAPDPGLVMGYYDADDLPVYDHLAGEYCVVDRWFSSVPGATWPNRLYSVAGRAEGSRDDKSPPIYALPSFARYLDQHQVDWRWYSFDPATLRAVDPEYRLSNHERFAFLDSRDLSTLERAVGELTEEGPSFLDDVAEGKLPQVSWIDPRFKDLRVLGPDSNDDHPPSDVIAGQDLILTIYHALSAAPTWGEDAPGHRLRRAWWLLRPRGAVASRGRRPAVPAPRGAGARPPGLAAPRRRLLLERAGAGRPFRPHLDRQDDLHALLQHRWADPEAHQPCFRRRAPRASPQ
jgi:phospholipase C